MKKLFIIIIMSLFFLVSMATMVMAEDEKGLVFYLSPDQHDEVQTTYVPLVKDAVERAGYSYKVMVAGQEDANLQMNQIEHAISQNPKAIILQAVDSTAICAGVDQARNAGISVISFVRGISKTNVDFSIVCASKKFGIVAAQETVKFLKEKYGEVKGSVLDIMGDPGDSYTVLVEEGFQEFMKDYPNVKIETKIAYKWEASKAADIADDYLLVHPEIDVIFTHADHLAAAVASILQIKDYTKDEIFLIGTCGMPVGLELIREGWMNLSVGYNLCDLAEGIAIFLDDIINKNEIKLGLYQIEDTLATLVEKPFGLELSVSCYAINSENVDDPKLWGNQLSD